MTIKASFEGSGEIPTPSIDDSEKESYLESSRNLQKYQYITPNKLALYLSDPTSHCYDIIQILDARFNYEYKGGKIISAINVTLFSSLIKLFERFQKEIEIGKAVCIIVYCEFSSKRGPGLYDMFRKYDRNLHISDYPNLSFPNLFLLEGGYNKFYSLYPNLCYRNYVCMYDPEFIKNGMIKTCQKNYFADYKEFSEIMKKKLNDYDTENLKLNFKFNSTPDQKIDNKETQEDQDVESQPKTDAFSTVFSNVSFTSI
ncbi:m-phase inducer phosphatase [Tritrichomonas musculus]|uniref:protein-tyrosine-phosphatase n=1 Tax=Tritrichomonas musculus TaxID=1915356 RepID=A0ABR2KBG1_9EUKA